MNIKSTVTYYWRHLRKYKTLLIVNLILVGVGSALHNVIQPIIFKRLIDVMGSARTPSASLDSIIWLVVLYGVVIFLYNVFYRISDYLSVSLKNKISKSLWDFLFGKIMGRDLGFFVDNPTGSLTARAQRFVDAFDTLHDMLVHNIWYGFIAMTGVFVALMWHEPVLGLVFLLWSCLFIAVSIFIMRKKMQADLDHAAEKSHTTSFFVDVIANIVNVKAFTALKREVEEFNATTGKLQLAGHKAGLWHTIQLGVQGFLVAIIQFVSVFVAVKLWMAGKISFSVIVLMQIYLFTLFTVMWNLGRHITRIMKALADANEMTQLLGANIKAEKLSHPKHGTIKNGSISFENVYFKYKDDLSASGVLKDLTLKIDAGSKLALIGHSGSGKSTFIKLLLRFMDVDSGTIKIGEQDITSFDEDELRKAISYVPQEPVLFQRSVLENIRYGRPNASDEEVKQAAKFAYAHEFIVNLPCGYDTVVGERGIKLSGGERQRIAIARAILKDAPILVFDEATSALDSVSEAKIQKAIHNLITGRTVLVIAHRLSTIKQMDRIVVFEDGRIVEDGTHGELIKKSGYYARYWNKQAEGYVR